MSRTGPALMLLLLLTAALLPMAAPPAVEPLAAPETPVAIQISNTTHWSGNVTIEDNVTVDPAGVLVIDAGANVTLTNMSWIRIEGELRIEGTEAAPATILSTRVLTDLVNVTTTNETTNVTTTTPTVVNLTTNIGLWHGFVTEVGANVSVANASIANAEASITILGEDAHVENLTTSLAFVGVNVTGANATLQDITCHDISLSCLLVTGSASATRVSVENVFTGIDVYGMLDLIDMDVNGSARAVAFQDGASGAVSDVDVTMTTQLVSVRGVVTATLDDASLSGGTLAIEASGSLGAALSNITVTSTDRLLIARELGGLSLTDTSLTTSPNGLAAIETSVAGDLSLTRVSVTGASAGMDLSGSGAVVLTDVDLDANWTALASSATGAITINGGQWTAGQNVARISAGTTTITGTSISGTSAARSGLALVGGTHTLTDVTLSRPYALTDTASRGLDIGWSTVTIDNVSSERWHTAVRCGRGCDASGDLLRAANGNPNSGRGVHMDGGSLMITTLNTSIHADGMRLTSGTAHVETWEPSAHGSLVAYVGLGATLTVRNLPAGGSLGQDASGPGSIWYGTSGTVSVAVASSSLFTEISIQVLDLESNPVVGVDVTSHGFVETTNATGHVMLPVLATGSLVAADDGSVGVADTFMSSSMNATLSLPILPLSGDWNLGANGTIATQLIDGTYLLPGNATIANGSTLTLRNATLQVAGGAMITVSGGSSIVGWAGALAGGDVTVDATSSLSGGDAGLMVAGMTTHACAGNASWASVHLDGGLDLSGGCQLTLVAGSADASNVTVDATSALIIRSELTVVVLDNGVPLAGVSVSIAGVGQSTDSNGEVSTDRAGVRINANGTNETGLILVSTNRAGVTQVRGWDTSQPSVALTFIFSTLQSGNTTGWVRPDATWSPWLLQDDLTVLEGTTLTLGAGVEVLVSPGVGISVLGVMQTASSTISGTDWFGISLDGPDASLTSTSTTMQTAERTLRVHAGTAVIDGAVMTGAIDGLVLQTGGDLTITNSRLQGAGSSCIQSNGGSLSVLDSELSACGDQALRAQTTELDLDGVTIGAGSSMGAWLLQTSGTMTNLNATGHDGTGAALRLDSQGPELTMSDLMLGGMGIGLSAEQSNGMAVTNLSVDAATGVHLINSSASLDGGTIMSTADGISIVGRLGFNPITINDLDITSGGAALSAAGDDGDAAAPPVVATNLDLTGTPAVDAENIALDVHGSALAGNAVRTGDSAAETRLVDSTTSGSVVVSGNGTITTAGTYTVTLVTAGNGVAGTLTALQDDLGTSQGPFDVTTAGIELVFATSVVTASGTTSTTTVTLQAASPGFLPTSVSRQLVSSALTVELSLNVGPTPTIRAPADLAEIESGVAFQLNGTASDADAAAGDPAPMVRWLLAGPAGGDAVVVLNTLVGTITVVEVGAYVLTLEATDHLGAKETVSITLTVVPQDNDDDNIDTCDVTTWFDDTLQRYCGPDSQDLDDDNDGTLDNRDAFPFDACASLDTDLDGMPDEIEPLCGTGLIVDTDDDGDGVPDSEDAFPRDARRSTAAEEGGDISLILWALVLVALVVVVVFILRMRDEDELAAAASGGLSDTSVPDTKDD